MSTLTFRNATEEDVGLVLEFIRKLADYEHRLDEVIATEDELKKWIFDKKQAEVIFALEDGKEIGFALFFLSFQHTYQTLICIWRTFSSTLSTVERATARRCLKNWQK